MAAGGLRRWPLDRRERHADPPERNRDQGVTNYNEQRQDHVGPRTSSSAPLVRSSARFGKAVLAWTFPILTNAPLPGKNSAMLFYNNSERGARGAHVAHALVVGLHALCCGAPLALMLIAAGLGASTGLAAAQGVVGGVHAALHGHEILILTLSALLVVVGGVAEWRMRAKHATRGFPVLFAASIACLFLNAGIIAAHRAHPTIAGVHAEEAMRFAAVE